MLYLVPEIIMFGLSIKNMKKENEMWLKFIKNLYIFKIFNIYIEEKNIWNNFEVAYKNNLMILNLAFIFLHIYLFSPIFPQIFRKPNITLVSWLVCMDQSLFNVS